MKFLIVGAGLTGATIARILADNNHPCVVLEEERFVAGNCYTEPDEKTKILKHCFGPHTLHSDNEEVWAFLKRFCDIYPYTHKKKAVIHGEYYPFPINLEAINKLFKTSFNSKEAEDYIARKAAPYMKSAPTNFEEAALAAVGSELYNAYCKGYTKKQWGIDPKELPAFIFRRLPVYLNNDSNVFHHNKQGQPVGGYTLMVEQMLNHPNITIKTNTAFDQNTDISGYDHIFYSGPIDRYFNWTLGALPYRSLEFKHEHHTGVFQPCGTVNYCDEDVEHTRIIEHKHFWPWEEHEDTVITYEISKTLQDGDRPYYPVRLTQDNQLFQAYVAKAEKEANVSFVGRLGTYRYLDMDKAIEEAMRSASETVLSINEGRTIPAFFFSPQTPE